MLHAAWNNIEKEKLNDRLSRKVLSGEKAMVAQMYLAKDCVVPLHHHVSEQLCMLMQGSLKFELEGREVVLNAGEVLVIPSDVPHRAVALEDSIAFDIFSPIRQDWLDGSDSYLRK